MCLVKSSRAMAYEVESKVHNYYRLCDQRIPRLQGCLEELATLEKCCSVVVHVMHTTVVRCDPVAFWVRQQSQVKQKCPLI